MAENLQFPILFDLEKGVETAIKDWDSKYADKLEKAIQKRALGVKLKFDTKAFDNLDDVKRRLAELKITPLTPENKQAIQELTKELKGLAKLMEKISNFKGIELPELQAAKAAKLRKDVAQADEKLRLSKERIRQAEERLILSQQRAAQQAKNTGKAFGEQGSYLSNLIKKMAVYASLCQVGNFLTSVSEVTAQFELQRVSLGAIIQDQQKANQLFGEIKSFALKSPLKILDLTKYTKQVAAYRIETDKLFDTTKRLADVSVGLGVDMGRLVLAYGQVKAASYLRAAEIRQFTEAGIPLLELLAEKFTELQGSAVSTEEVMDKVSRRMVSFSMVEEIFKDMTDAGGMFYNMQERQGNTLFGMWAKLGDAASMMYDEIGNTSQINKGMKDSINLLTEMMKNWRYLANAMMIAVPTMLLVHNIEKSRAAASARQIAATNTLTAATAKRIAAEKALNQAVASGLANTAAKARMNLILAQTEEKVAQKALTSGNSIGLLGKRFNVFGSALKNLSAFVATNFWTILLTGIALVTSAIVSANEKANRLKNRLAEIGASGSLELGQSVQNFERLAKIAVESADGSKKQRDALEELHRTYKDMIPVQNMTIEKLRAMDGDYRKLTIVIEEYIRARMKQQQIDVVTSEIGADLAKFERKMAEDAKGLFYTYDNGATKLKLTYDQIQLLIKGIKEITKTERDLPTRKVFTKALTDYVGLDADNLEVGLDEWLNTFDDGLFGIVRSVRQFEGEIDRIKANEALDTTLGKYAESWKKVNERIENLTVKGAKVGSFTFDRATANASVKQYVGYLKEVLGDAWDESFASIEEHVGANGENMSAIYWEAVMRNWDSYAVAQQNAILKVQKSYDGLLPSDRTVVILREKLQQISGQFGVNMDITKQYLMNAGEDIEAYAKRVKSSLEEAQNNLKELRFNKSQIEAGVGTGVLKPVSDEEIEKADNLTKVLAALFELISAFSKGNSGGGSKSDPRLQNLKEEISLVQKLYNEYKQLEKQEGATKAAEDMRRMAGGTLDMFKEKYNIDLPTDAEDLTAALEILYAKMAQLPKKVFPALDKDLKELRWTIEKVNIDESQKQIESELKRLADRISRTKTAKEFYEKILNTTGDYSLASKVAESIFGQNGSELRKALAEQVRSMAGDIPLPDNIISADNVIDYKALRQFAEANKNELGKMYDELIKISNDGQKDLAKTYEGYLKDLEKAKSYSDKRIELARYTANQIAEINASALPEDEKQRLTAGYREREDKEAAKLQYEAFKNSALYVQMFEDLDHASTSALTRMRDRLIDLKSQWKNLSPTELKELQSRLNELDTQIAARNPFKALGDAYKKWRDLIKSGRTKEGDEANADAAEKARQEAEKKMLADEKAYEAVASSLGANSVLAKVYRSIADKSKEAYDNAEKTANETAEMVTDWGDISELIANANQKIDEYQQQINEALDGVRKMMEAFGASDEDMQFFDDVVSSLNEIVDAGQDAATAVGAFMSGDIFTGITKGISAIGGLVLGFSNLFHAGKVRKANKEIKHQQELLDQLEYTYGRLEKAADKAFGADYLQNYNQQIKNLQVQQAAYLKQAEAERSKGKKEDKERTKEYLENARDVADQIKELQDDLVAQIVGTDVASAARDFANAWLDAYLSFGSTTDAIKEKFDDMIKNMIVNMVLAQVVKRALEPIFKMIDDLAADGELSADDIAKVMSKVPSTMTQINDGLSVGVKALEAAGVDISKLREGSSEFSGIAKDFAGATSEEINTAAAIGNTIMYHTSHLPIISQNVAAIYQLMSQGRGAALPDSGSTGWTDWRQQAMDNYIAIQRNTADTVVECRRAANACEAATEKLNRIIVAKGGKFAVNTTYV